MGSYVCPKCHERFSDDASMGSGGDGLRCYTCQVALRPISSIMWCPDCSMRVILMENGKCPTCQAAIGPDGLGSPLPVGGSSGEIANPGQTPTGLAKNEGRASHSETTGGLPSIGSSQSKLQVDAQARERGEPGASDKQSSRFRGALWVLVFGIVPGVILAGAIWYAFDYASENATRAVIGYMLAAAIVLSQLPSIVAAFREHDRAGYIFALNVLWSFVVAISIAVLIDDFSVWSIQRFLKRFQAMLIWSGSIWVALLTWTANRIRPSPGSETNIDPTFGRLCQVHSVDVKTLVSVHCVMLALPVLLFTSLIPGRKTENANPGAQGDLLLMVVGVGAIYVFSFLFMLVFKEGPLFLLIRLQLYADGVSYRNGWGLAWEYPYSEIASVAVSSEGVFHFQLTDGSTRRVAWIQGVARARETIEQRVLGAKR